MLLKHLYNLGWGGKSYGLGWKKSLCEGLGDATGLSFLWKEAWRGGKEVPAPERLIRVHTLLSASWVFCYLALSTSHNNGQYDTKFTQEEIRYCDLSRIALWIEKRKKPFVILFWLCVYVKICLIHTSTLVSHYWISDIPNRRHHSVRLASMGGEVN